MACPRGPAPGADAFGVKARLPRLWPESNEATAQANLRRSLNELRRIPGDASALLRAPRPRTLLLDPGDVDADVLSFDRLIARGEPEALETAVGLYRGPLLDGCSEPWVLPERQVREEAYLTALETRATRAVGAGEAGSAAGYLRRAIATDPLRESAHRALMQALAADGNYAAALSIYRDLRLLLHRELNTEPDAETTALFQQLQAEARGKAARMTADRRPPTAVPSSSGVDLSHESGRRHRSSPPSGLPSGLGAAAVGGG